MNMTDVMSAVERLSSTYDISREHPFVLGPDALVIATTLERISLSDRLAARVEGKSSLARLGISVHLTAPKVDPGFSNYITLEIKNSGPHRVALSPMMTIATLILEELRSPATVLYTGQFNAP